MFFSTLFLTWNASLCNVSGRNWKRINKLPRFRFSFVYFMISFGLCTKHCSFFCYSIHIYCAMQRVWRGEYVNLKIEFCYSMVNWNGKPSPVHHFSWATIKRKKKLNKIRKARKIISIVCRCTDFGNFFSLCRILQMYFFLLLLFFVCIVCSFSRLMVAIVSEFTH